MVTKSLSGFILFSYGNNTKLLVIFYWDIYDKKLNRNGPAFFWSPWSYYLPLIFVSIIRFYLQNQVPAQHSMYTPRLNCCVFRVPWPRKPRGRINLNSQISITGQKKSDFQFWTMTSQLYLDKMAKISIYSFSILLETISQFIIEKYLSFQRFKSFIHPFVHFPENFCPFSIFRENCR